MSRLAKDLRAASRQVSGDDVDDVFSQYMYVGTQTSNRAIDNGIDLSTHGGLIWAKPSTGSNEDHFWMDTERYPTPPANGGWLRCNSSGGPSTDPAQAVVSWNTDGANIGAAIDNSSYVYDMWTFRKREKFFDIQTWTGDDVDNRVISHNLTTTPGMIIIKSDQNGNNWQVWHRSASANLWLNTPNAEDSATTEVSGYVSAASASGFTLTNGSLNFDYVNKTGSTYVAYIFAHNDGDGNFGPNSDQDIIKCGGFQTDGNGDATINLGFEPQYLFFKNRSASANWYFTDGGLGWMGFSLTPDQLELRTLSHTASSRNDWSGGNGETAPTATGFQFYNGFGGTAANADIIYMAIRKGPLKAPESSLAHFAVNSWTGNGTSGVDRIVGNTGMPLDMQFVRKYNPNPASGPSANQNAFIRNRIQRGLDSTLQIASGSVYTTYSRAKSPYSLAAAIPTNGLTANIQGDFGVHNNTGSLNTSGSSYVAWSWKSAPSFFDVCPFTGTGTGVGDVQAVPHNLGVVPEMMWITDVSSTSGTSWNVYHKDLTNTAPNDSPEDNRLELDGTNVPAVFTGFANTAPTSTTFTVGLNDATNKLAARFVGYLFASCPGVAKVGSYTGDGTDGRVIDCGFSNGSQYLIIRRVDDVGDWNCWDVARGMGTGTTPWVRLNNNTVQAEGYDVIDPDSSGFAVNATGGLDINTLNATYIFYAVAAYP